jgi:hypothetical protein
VFYIVSDSLLLWQMHSPASRNLVMATDILVQALILLVMVIDPAAAV